MSTCEIDEEGFCGSLLHSALEQCNTSMLSTPIRGIAVADVALTKDD